MGNGSTSAPNPTINGTAEPGATVTVTEAGLVVCTAVADAAGQWSCASNLVNGGHEIIAVAVDAVGNTSPSSTNRFTIDDVPRVTVKHFQPIDSLAKKTRLQLELVIDDGAALAAIVSLLAAARGGNGLVRATLPVSAAREAIFVLGRDFLLDADLASRIERLLGQGNVILSAQEGPKLALVG